MSGWQRRQSLVKYEVSIFSISLKIPLKIPFFNKSPESVRNWGFKCDLTVI